MFYTGLRPKFRGRRHCDTVHMRNTYMTAAVRRGSGVDRQWQQQQARRGRPRHRQPAKDLRVQCRRRRRRPSSLWRPLGTRRSQTSQGEKELESSQPMFCLGVPCSTCNSSKILSVFCLSEPSVLSVSFLPPLLCPSISPSHPPPSPFFPFYPP
jgi:hypothetical protein